jgi:hypothetical protein
VYRECVVIIAGRGGMRSYFEEGGQRNVQPVNEEGSEEKCYSELILI